MKLMMIEWIDSHSGSGWQSMETVKNELLYCRSVGWLVSENDKSILIASSISGEKNGDIKLCVGGDVCIPKKAIIKKIVLTERSK